MTLPSLTSGNASNPHTSDLTECSGIGIRQRQVRLRSKPLDAENISDAF